VGQALIATWLPWKYYIVSTIQLAPTSKLQQLTDSIDQGVPYGDAIPGPVTYLTQVFRCDQEGFVKNVNKPLYEQEFIDISTARERHDEVVALLAAGHLKVKSLRRRR
jgi:hypothetical protein